MSYVLGISAFYHDSAACLIKNGKIVSACQEERFTRIKHDYNFPVLSIKYILKENKLSILDIEYIVFYEKPFLKFERLVETYLYNCPKGFSSFSKAMPLWLREKLFQKDLIIKELKKINKKVDKNKIYFSEHHLSHAASAFYPSPYDKAAILTIDGVGEWATSTISLGKGNKINIKREINFPHSLGLLYSAFTYYLGFKVNSGEYKVMGLAPYGKPIYSEKIKKNLIDIKEDGSFRLNQKYFNYSAGLTMVNNKFEKIFKRNIRDSQNENLDQFHMDIAASIQNVTEEIILKICKFIKAEYKTENLCIAGGVGLNCVANGKILQEKIFKNIWIQPASGDAGGALGCALAFWHDELNNPRRAEQHDSMKGSYLGPKYYNDDIKKELEDTGAVIRFLENQDIFKTLSKDLIEGKAIGLFQGRMEFGPRALGCRSIIADPRIKTMQKNLNLKVKFRESFRPFAPAIMEDKLKEWFDINSISPYMLMIGYVKESKRIINSNSENFFGIEKLNQERSLVPAITHLDYSARIQTVSKRTNNFFYQIIQNFYQDTGCPILINTSFNVRGEPIVNTPKDAFNCFMGTNLDILVVENYYLKKEEQNKSLFTNYKDKFELD